MSFYSEGITSDDYLEAYLDIKEKDNKILQKIDRDEFLKKSGLSRHYMDKIFGDFKTFQLQAEDIFFDRLSSGEKAIMSEVVKKYDPSATKEDCIRDLRELKEANPLKIITRNFYRIHGKYSDSTWSKFFGTHSEFRRQAGLELNRYQHAVERGVAKHASVDHYSEYYETQVLPFHNKYVKAQLPTRFKRLMIISDLHDEECDDFTLEVFIAECKRKQPDVIVLNGDISDMYELSSYSKDPRKVRMKERIDYLHNRILGPLRAACPNAQIDYIMGNHEYRLITHLANATPHLRVLLSDVMNISFSDVFGLDKFSVNWVSKFDLRAFSKKDIKDQMKKNYKIYYDCYAVCHEPDARLIKSMSGTNGHHHRASYASEANAIHGSITWVQTPAGHVTDAEYIDRLCAWNTGFLEVLIDSEAKKVQQTIRPTQDFIEIDGILYTRKEDNEVQS